MRISDVCIIGGGLAGSNIAHGLSKEKKRIIFLEKKFLTAGASRETVDVFSSENLFNQIKDHFLKGKGGDSSPEA